MRIRTIKPEFYKHDGLAQLSPLVRLLFTGLWCMADCAGRLEDRPKRIKAEVIPYDDCDVDSMLSELASCGFIVRYEVKNERFIEIPAFRRHQRITGKEADSESRFPAPTGSKVATKGSRRGNNGETTGKQPESLEGKGRETEGKGNGAVAFPLPLDTPEFHEAWQRFLDYRISIKKPVRPESIAEKLKELASYGSAISCAAISASIGNGWQGLFPEKIQHELNRHAHTTGTTAAGHSAHNALSLNRTAASSYRKIGEKLRVGVAGNGTGDEGGASGTQSTSP